MENYNDAGRIPRHAFIVSTSLLFALSLVSVFARYCIRIGVQREFSFDDAFLLLGSLCLTAAMVVLYVNMDDMYLVEALTFAPPASLSSLLSSSTPAEVTRMFDKVYEFRKLITASLILTWVALMSVKFAFLALFRRLIDRMPRLIKYWWVVVFFNIAVTGYGSAVYVIACPHFSGPKVLSCLGGGTRRKTMHYAISQLVLDVIGDFLILYIPVRLIWTVKIRTTQKLTLACSLCLTVIVIIFTITRASGLEWHSKLDVIWEIYFQTVSAEVGLVLVSMTAFRALFVSRLASNPQHSPQKPPSTLWSRSKTSIRKIFDLRGWSTLFRSRGSSEQEKLDDTDTEDRYDLPNNIPGGVMTGMQTFINGQGQIQWSDMKNAGYPQTLHVGQAA